MSLALTIDLAWGIGIALDLGGLGSRPLYAALQASKEGRSGRLHDAADGSNNGRVDPSAGPSRQVIPIRPLRCLAAAVAFSVVLICVLGAAGGSGSSLSRASTTLPDSGVRVYGVVQASPTCPVERKGHPCPQRPLSGVRVEARVLSGQVVASARTRSNGSYVLTVIPGIYVLAVKMKNTFPRCPLERITVRPRSPEKADINCDTGIR
jgi:hypothetical protein